MPDSKTLGLVWDLKTTGCECVSSNANTWNDYETQMFYKPNKLMLYIGKTLLNSKMSKFLPYKCKFLTGEDFFSGYKP